VRLKLVACEILYREVCACIARSRNIVDVEFLPKGLHDLGAATMRERIQAAIDAVDASAYQAIALGYALCGMGLNGVAARSLPLVLPRAHDCITLFLGSAERYARYFNDHPGVYFKTTGWIERGADLAPLERERTGIGQTCEELATKYGEDNAKYLYEQLGSYSRNYGQITFIEMGTEPDGRFERAAREEAAARGWRYEKISGDLSLLQRLVDGDWEGGAFAVAPPGGHIVARYDERILGAVED